MDEDVELLLRQCGDPRSFDVGEICFDNDFDIISPISYDETFPMNIIESSASSEVSPPDEWYGSSPSKLNSPLIGFIRNEEQFSMSRGNCKEFNSATCSGEYFMSWGFGVCEPKKVRIVMDSKAVGSPPSGFAIR